MRIASFFIKPTVPAQNEGPTQQTSTPVFVSNFLLGTKADIQTAPMMVSSAGIWNHQEPQSSDELPNPVYANYYKSNNYVYHFIEGKWKRTALVAFNE